jgi:hypothetical protein
MVPPNGFGKDLVTDVLSQLTIQAHVCEERENNFLPIAYFMANFGGALGCHARVKHGRVQTHSKPARQEKDSATCIFHG